MHQKQKGTYLNDSTTICIHQSYKNKNLVQTRFIGDSVQLVRDLDIPLR